MTTRRFWHFVFGGFILVYVAMLSYQLGHGLASLDAHAIVKVTRELVDEHRLEVSRPPGHPTTEIYLFPVVAWMLRHGFNIAFDEIIYLIAQGLAAVGALCGFYALILKIGAPPWKAVLAAICLGLSPQFFSNAVDGEEFVLAVLFLTGSLYLLIRREESTLNGVRWIGAIALFALATGCRPEVSFAAFLFPLCAIMHPRMGPRTAINILVIETLAMAIVWLPILLIGLHAPYTSGMNVTQSILGGGYRLIFQCFTLPVFVLMCWVLVRSWAQWRRGIHQPYPGNFIFVACCVTPLVFFGALFLHASKPSHVLFALPFVLILAVRRSAALLIGWAVATVIGFFVAIDIFTDRQLGRPHLVSGTYLDATRQKPFYKLDYLQSMLQHCGPSTALIGDLWPWDIQYHIARGTFVAKEEMESDVPAFIVASAGGEQPTREKNCVLLPRDAALHQDSIDDLADHGYRLKMDAILYRTLFARYDVITPSTNKGRIGNTTVELFPIIASWR